VPARKERFTVVDYKLIFNIVAVPMTSFVTYFMSRRKSDAEIKKMNAETDVTVARAAMELANALREALKEARASEEEERKGKEEERRGRECCEEKLDLANDEIRKLKGRVAKIEENGYVLP
jgi:DNA topoisomerase VI subunit B